MTFLMKNNYEDNVYVWNQFSKIEKIRRSYLKLWPSYLENLENEKQLYKKDIEIFISKNKETVCFYSNSIMALLNSWIDESFWKEIHEDIIKYSKYVERVLVTKAELKYLELSNIYEKKEYLEYLMKDNNI